MSTGTSRSANYGVHTTLRLDIVSTVVLR